MQKRHLMVEDTKNPYQDIQAIANSLEVPIEYLDFHILNVCTEYKLHPDDEFMVAPDNSIFDDDVFMINPELSLQQSYKVEFYDVREVDRPHLPQITLGANKSLTKVVATIKPDSMVSYSNDFEKELTDSIYKKMIKVGIFIGIRDKEFKKEIKKIISVLRIKEKMDKTETIVTTTGVEAILPVNDRLNFYYKDDEQDEKNKIDHADRGFLRSVIEEQVVIEYIKPKTGIAGRNVKGELIPVEEPKVSETKQISVSENIKVEDGEDSIKYIALKKGYVSESGGKYDIKDELDVNVVNMKTTGSIKTDLDSDVTINIKENDFLKDAVGAGMSIETSEVNIEGNVAQGATIVGKNVTIGGSTHAKSTITADKAKISVHLGYLECEEAKIDRLEGGRVKAKCAFINSALGGEIVAEEIHIETLYSNANLIASGLIEVGQLKGDNNRFCIDVARVLDYDGKLDDYNAKMHSLNNEIKSLLKELETKKKIIDSNKISVNMIKSRIEEMRAQGLTPPLSFISKLKYFQALVYEYNSILKRLNDKKSDLNAIKDELKSIQTMVFKSKIINKDRWIEMNEIKFKLIEPPKDITYSTKDNELARLITLKALGSDEEGSYEIIKSNEL